MLKQIIYIYILFLSIIQKTNSQNTVKIHLTNLLINNSPNNSFIDHSSSSLKFSWFFNFESNNDNDIKMKNVKQKAYQIEIYQEQEEGRRRKEIINTKKVISERNINILINTKGMIEQKSCYKWIIKSWININVDEKIESEVYEFCTGVNGNEWDINNVKWIGGGNIYRKEFELNDNDNDERIKNGMMYISGIGYYEVYMNGEKVGERILEPGWTNYNKTVYYTSYKIEKYLKKKNNAIGVMIGNGWYLKEYYGLNNTEKCLKMMIHIEYESGKVFQLVTDDKNGWKTTLSSPIIEDDVYNGEIYDARLEQTSWNYPNFKNSSKWDDVKVIQGPLGVMKMQKKEPILIDEFIEPIQINKINDESCIIDFGQNFAGVCRIRMINCKGKRGTKIQIRHAEIVKSDGTLYIDNLRGAKARDIYIIKGESNEEIYQPRFTYHGFRYVEVTGINENDFQIDGVFFHSAVPEIGDIHFLDDSYDLFNKIQRNIIYGQKSNLMSIPTDCPQRDERLGWLADMHLSAEEAMYNFDMFKFYVSYLEEIVDEFRKKDFAIPNIVPFIGRFSKRAEPSGDPSWTSGYIILVDYIYSTYGDIRILEYHYPFMEKYIDFIDSIVRNVSLKDFFCQFGDWCPPSPRKEHLCHYTASFYLLLNLQQMYDLSDVLGKRENMKKYQSLIEFYQSKFLDAFYDEKNMKIMDNSQTAISLALYLDIFKSESVKEYFIAKLVENVVSKNNYHLTTGIVGTNYIFQVLSKTGYHDVALALALRTTYPSFGYMIYNEIEDSATTLWELWNSPTGDPNMDSRNHIMFGSIGAWFYKYIAGIEGKFDNIKISPNIYPALGPEKIKANYKSANGNVSVEIEVFNSVFCRIVDENYNLSIKCPKQSKIKEITFCSYGYPKGRCVDFVQDQNCHDESSKELIERECLGKKKCEVNVKKSFNLKCDGTRSKQLYVSGICDMRGFEMNLIVNTPVNTEAIIVIPVDSFNINEYEIHENNLLIWANDKWVHDKMTTGILSGYKDKNDKVIFIIGSGEYHFVLTSVNYDWLIYLSIGILFVFLFVICLLVYFFVDIGLYVRKKMKNEKKYKGYKPLMK